MERRTRIRSRCRLNDEAPQAVGMLFAVSKHCSCVHSARAAQATRSWSSTCDCSCELPPAHPLRLADVSRAHSRVRPGLYSGRPTQLARARSLRQPAAARQNDAARPCPQRCCQQERTPGGFRWLASRRAAMPPLRALHVVGVLGSALYSLRRAKRAEPPAHFCCSITGDLFVDPVIVVSSGAQRIASHARGCAGGSAPLCTANAAPRKGF